MLYDIVRWGAGIILFFILFAVLALATKKKGKSALIAVFASIIFSAVMLFIPVENVFYSFTTVEKAYNYKHHEPLLAYAECDEGAVCIGTQNGKNDVFYFFNKAGGGYKIPKLNESNITIRSSEFGVYAFKQFKNCMLIVTQVKGSSYNGEAFAECEGGYYTYAVVKGNFNNGQLYCNGEKVTLV